MDIFLVLIFLRYSSGHVSKFLLLYIISPDTTSKTLGSKSPVTDNPIKVLPDPDSPTIPRVSPLLSVRLILFSKKILFFLFFREKFLISNIFIMILSQVTL